VADRNESPILIVLALLAIAISATSAFLGDPKPALSRPGAPVVPPSLDVVRREYLPVSDSMVPVREQGLRAAVPRDPFGPVGQREIARADNADTLPLLVTEPPWVVSAILISPSDRMAVVNDSLVKAGDRLPGGARVVEVEPNHVVLADAQQVRHILRLREPGK